MSWSEGLQTLDAAVDNGVFRFCDVPRGRRVTFAADLPGGRRTGALPVVVGPGGVAARNLGVRAP